MYIVTCENEPCYIASVADEPILIPAAEASRIALFAETDLAEEAIQKTLDVLSPMLHLISWDRDNFEIHELDTPYC